MSDNDPGPGTIDAVVTGEDWQRDQGGYAEEEWQSQDADSGGPAIPPDAPRFTAHRETEDGWLLGFCVWDNVERRAVRREWRSDWSYQNALELASRLNHAECESVPESQHADAEGRP